MRRYNVADVPRPFCRTAHATAVKVEVASVAAVVARAVNMPARRKAMNLFRLDAARNKVGNNRLDRFGKISRDADFDSRRRVNRHDCEVSVRVDVSSAFCFRRSKSDSKQESGKGRRHNSIAFHGVSFRFDASVRSRDLRRAVSMSEIVGIIGALKLGRAWRRLP
ncbi:MAG TPA: hypothetical protein VFB29_00480 [Pseudolabrys sp.]|nr:hypothetical protein [Pseudolabrys sp.]